MKSMKIKKIISAVMCMAMLSAMINAPTAWADGVTATIKDGGAVIATLSESELKDYLPEKDGYKFIGLCDEGGAVIDTSKELTATATFYAMWLENPKFSASADGTKLVSTKITSDIQSPEAEVITAFYKNDELVKASVNQNTASYSDTDRAKVMVWNSLKSMKPLMGAIDGSFDALALTDPVKDVNGKVHNYSENQFNYLNDSAASFDEALISNYAKGNALIEQAPVTIAWNSSENVTGYTLKLADNAELENAEEIGLENDVTSYDLYDLYTGTDYYWQVTAKLESGAEVSKASTFTTENIGPRVVSIEGLQNTRDIGGYASSLTDSME